MRLCVVSAFRDSAGVQLQRFHRQLRALEETLRAPLTFLACEGDSRDHTRQALIDEAGARKADAGRRTLLIEVGHGGPRYGSTEEPARLAMLSTLLNTALDHVPGKDLDAIVWVESDLIWGAHALLRLADVVRARDDVGVCGAMCYAGDPFYDTWGCRQLGNGEHRMPPFAPYFSEAYLATHQMGDLVEMASVGSAVAFTPPVARDVRVQDGQALVGWCAEARRLKYRVWIDRACRVDHPHAGRP